MNRAVLKHCRPLSEEFVESKCQWGRLVGLLEMAVNDAHKLCFHTNCASLAAKVRTCMSGQL